MTIKPIFNQIWRLAEPYLRTRYNEIHTEICLRFGYRLVKAEGGNERIIIPAIILHDVGWQKVPECAIGRLLSQLTSHPYASMFELSRLAGRIAHRTIFFGINIALGKNVQNQQLGQKESIVLITAVLTSFILLDVRWIGHMNTAGSDIHQTVYQPVPVVSGLSHKPFQLLSKAV